MSSSSSSDGGRLAANLAGFVRTLRHSGLPLGPGSILDAIAATRAVGLQRRDDFREALRAVLVHHPDQQALFEQAFHVYFRNPRLLERLMSLLMPQLQTPETSDAGPGSKRLAEALFGTEARSAGSAQREVEFDAAFTASDREMLQHKDFEQMSVEELAAAREMLRRADVLFEEMPTRRFRSSVRGKRIDLRGSLRGMLRTGGDVIPLSKRRPRARHPALVLICDISGSMSRYSRMFLHFAHAVTSARDRVFTFVFATRLTNVTRELRDRDLDQALRRLANGVEDWSSGTRIGDCLKAFNQDWSRRVLTQGALVLLVSDGLDRGDPDRLAAEMARLNRSCRRLIWLNPLLRYRDFEPLARGARVILPFVDELRAAHNIASLNDLGALLQTTRGEGMARAR